MLIGLSACGEDEADQTGKEELALFSDVALDSARLEVISSVEVEEGVDLEGVPDGEELNLQTSTPLESAAVLSGADGYVYYIQEHTTHAFPWRIWRFDQKGNQKTLLYKGVRELQSVTGSLDGMTVVFSGRQNADNTGDFELFRLELNTTTAMRLTDNNSDDLDVSSDASVSRIAYSRTDSRGRKAVFYRDYSGTEFTEARLRSGRDQVQPSITANGEHIALVRLYEGSTPRLFVYTLATNTYLRVTGSRSEVEHPSVSNDKTKVAWLQHNRSRDLIKIKDLGTGRVTNVERDINAIRHPHLAADGDYLTYSKKTDTWHTYTKNLETGETAKGTGFTPVNSSYAMFWQKSESGASPPSPIPEGASVRRRVVVPSGMTGAPFNVPRYLNVPPGFSISVYSRSGGRFMAVAPNDDLLISQPGSGRVLLLRPNQNGGAPQVHTYASGLRKPHDIVFHTIGATTYVYIAETHQINRYIYRTGDTSGRSRQIVVSGLPDKSTPELNGAYGHELKNIALDSNHKLYVSIASTCNVCLSDTRSNPLRGAIYQYDADGTNRRLFAKGLRNAEGLAFLPETNDLWVTVANRDEIKYPFHNDFDGNGTDDYGKLMRAYTDDHPPELFTYVRDGGNYGWPFCNANPDTASGYNTMPYDRDVDFNGDGSRLDCSTIDRVTQGIQAHSTALGLLFLQDTAFPTSYREGVALAYRGSWNRTKKTGYKVAYFPWRDGEPLDQLDLVNGWLNDTTQTAWGRPVDIAVDSKGDMYISDDTGFAIYKLTYTGD